MEFELFERRVRNLPTSSGNGAELKEYIISPLLQQKTLPATKTILDVIPSGTMGWRIMTSNTVLIDQKMSKAMGPIASVVSLNRNPPPRDAEEKRAPQKRPGEEEKITAPELPPEIRGPSRSFAHFLGGFLGQINPASCPCGIFAGHGAWGNCKRMSHNCPVGLELLVYNAEHFEKVGKAALSTD